MVVEPEPVVFLERINGSRGWHTAGLPQPSRIIYFKKCAGMGRRDGFFSQNRGLPGFNVELNPAFGAGREGEPPPR